MNVGSRIIVTEHLVCPRAFWSPGQKRKRANVHLPLLQRSTLALQKGLKFSWHKILREKKSREGIYIDDKRCMMNLEKVLSSCFTCDDQRCHLKVELSKMLVPEDNQYGGITSTQVVLTGFRDRTWGP